MLRGTFKVFAGPSASDCEGVGLFTPLGIDLQHLLFYFCHFAFMHGAGPLFFHGQALGCEK